LTDREEGVSSTACYQYGMYIFDISHGDGWGGT
jgi:hypothetical protein